MSHTPSDASTPVTDPNEESGSRAPVCGSCLRCGDPLGYAASERDGVWYCCGPCADSGRCTCGCQPERAKVEQSATFVPTRRMFASRAPDELRGAQDGREQRRAFPFAERRR